MPTTRASFLFCTEVPDIIQLKWILKHNGGQAKLRIVGKGLVNSL